MVPVVLPRLPDATKYEWSTSLPTTGIPKFEVLLMFSDHHVNNILITANACYVAATPRRTPQRLAKVHLSTPTALEKALPPHWVTARLGRDGHSLENCLYMTLWKLCNSRVTFRQLSDRFNIAKGTSHRVFNKTIQAICNLKSEIEWPSVDRQQEVMTNFENSRESPFPFVIGCLDGTHFNIPTPSVDAISYYDRKGNHSVSMQAICDSQYRFLDVFIGYPGSCHDANVSINSPIFQAITSGELQLAPSAVILGESAYPISQFLIIPHRDNGHLSREQKTFNARLSSTRVFIEQAFGIFKKKFKILNYIEASSIKATSNVIFACAILHNFIINRGGYFEHINDTITHSDMETNNEIGGIQDAPIRRADSDDINGEETILQLCFHHKKFTLAHLHLFE
ncbi:putative nuclease HARBI1 [Anastrepha obliqua]|uniref:putative nuclease HARBI1 n=1 Tax=Anastrepha obliqua TaxID=95512 RepID=UPI00240A78ED|nr:putative nuclease HARBI1 [Anastrepha obliqua]